MYIFLFIFTTLGGESKTQLIRANALSRIMGRSGTPQEMEGMVKVYMNSINLLSRQYPHHNIELNLEINKPILTRHPPPSSKRRNFRIINIPKRMLRSENISTEPTTTATTPSRTTSSTTVSYKKHLDESETAPIYLDDLKKALDDFEKKLAPKSDCNGEHENAETTERSTTTAHMCEKSQSTTKPNRDRHIQDILQLIRKGVKVEYDVQKPTDDNMDWLQIKIPHHLR